MGLRIQPKRFGTKITIFTAVFALALQPLAGIVLSRPADAISGSVVYDALPSTSPATNYPSQAFQATSTSEFGDYIHLGGANRILDKVTVTMSNWAKYSTYSSNPQYAGNSASWTLPVTVNIYDNQFDANGTPTHKIATVTQNQSISWRPESSPDCAPTSNGAGWKVGDTCYNYSGIASNIVFDLSSLQVALPDDIVVSVAYNTQTRGYAPTGVPGPYDSLNVAVPASQPVVTGSDADTSSVLVNSTWSGAYGDGGVTGVFRKASDRAPNGTVALRVTATAPNTAPVVTFNAPTPANNSYISGTVTGNVTATDDYGMGSYYLRFWKDAFEVAGGGTLLNPGSCQSAPGAFLLGLSQTVGCSFDTTSLADGTKVVFSAQFLDGHTVWGDAKRTFTVDNTKPKITVKTGTGINDGTVGTDPYSRISFKLNDPHGGLKEVVLNGHVYPRTNEWNDLNWQNIIKSHLIEGSNTIYVVDRAGNQSNPLTFVYDKTAPTATLSYSPNGPAPTKNNVTVTLTTSEPIIQSVLPGTWLKVSDTVYKKVYPANNVQSVTLQDLAGNTGSVTVTIDWIDKVAPAAPILGTPANNSVVKGASVTQSWNSTSSDVHHYVYESYNDAAATSLRWRENFTATSKTATNVANATYWWRVKAVDNAGNESGWSPLWKLTIDSDSPVVTIPSYSVLSNVITPAVNVTDSNNPLIYAWTQTAGPTAGVTISDAAVAEPQFTVVEDGTYTFKLTVTDPAGNASTSTFSFDYAAPAAPVVPIAPVVPTVVQINQTPTTGTGFTNVAVATVPADDADATAVNNQTQGETAVQGASDSKDGKVLAATATPEVMGAATAELLGLAWYWWVVIATAAVGLGWWFLAALRRRNADDV